MSLMAESMGMAARSRMAESRNTETTGRKATSRRMMAGKSRKDQKADCGSENLGQHGAGYEGLDSGARKSKADKYAKQQHVASGAQRVETATDKTRETSRKANDCALPGRRLTRNEKEQQRGVGGGQATSRSKNSRAQRRNKHLCSRWCSVAVTTRLNRVHKSAPRYGTQEDITDAHFAAY